LEELECAFGCCWKDLDEHDLMEFIYLVRFGFRNVGDIDFKVISITENSNKFQKNPSFGRKNQLRAW
jgi:hypothetical protein